MRVEVVLVIGGLVCGCTSIVALVISLRSMCALLLDEYSLQGGSSASILNHHLLRGCGVWHFMGSCTTASRVLLLIRVHLLHLGLWVDHVLVWNLRSLDRGGHGTRLAKSIDWVWTSFTATSLTCSAVLMGPFNIVRLRRDSSILDALILHIVNLLLFGEARSIG